MRLYTTRQVGDMLGHPQWRIRRLFEDGTLPEPDKFGNNRVIPESLLPKILAALKDKGYKVLQNTQGE